MRLKWLDLRAFKAYEELTHLDFDERINCIVGLNGSGKSTILEAITVLVAEVCGRRTAEAKTLLHKGARHQAVLGHVEICLEPSSEEKLAGAKEGALRLKKTFSLSGSGDAYFIDGKRSTKQNFVAILTSAGFSRNNPYYIVGQGKVQDLAVISDETRLKLLKDLSGIGIYEEKRNEALKRLEEHKTNLLTLDTSLIEERLANLRKQKAAIQRRNQLQEQEEVYQLLAQQISLYGRLLSPQTLESGTQETEALVPGGAEAGCWASTQPPKTQCELRLLEELNSLIQDLTKIDNRLEQVNEFGAVYNTKRGEINSRESEWREITEAAKKSDREISGLRRKQLEIKCRLSELSKKDDQRAKNEAKLESTLLPERLALLESVQDLDKRILDLQADVERHRLSAGLNLGQYKSSKEKRQHVLTCLIPSIQQQIAELNQDAQSMTSELEAALRDADQYSRFRGGLECVNSNIQRAQAELSQVTKRLAELTATERPFDRSSVEQEYSKVDRLYKAAVRRGYNCVLRARDQSPGDFMRECHDGMTRWLAEGNNNPDFDGDILGPVWSLIEPVSRELETAVNAALAMKLDALVVRDDEVASALCSVIKNSQMPGASLTVTPLKQITAKFNYERRTVNARGVALSHTDQKLRCWTKDIEAVPLISALIPAHGASSDKLDSLLRQIAGNFILVRDADIGNRLRSVSDCVCLDGTLITKKGTLTGGYRPTHNNVLAVARNIRLVCGEALESASHVDEKHTLQAQRIALQAKLNNNFIERQALEGHIRSAAISCEASERLQARLQNLELKKTKLQTSLKTYTEFVTQKPETNSSSAEALNKFKMATENLANAQRERKDMQVQIEDLDSAITAVRRFLTRAVDNPRSHIEQELSQIDDRLTRESAMSQALHRRQEALHSSLDQLQEELHQLDFEFSSGGLPISAGDLGEVLVDQLTGEKENVSAQIAHIQASLAEQQQTSAKLVNRLKQRLLNRESQQAYLQVLDEITTAIEGHDKTLKNRIEAAHRNIRKELESMGPLNNRAVEDLELHQEEYDALVKESAEIQASTEKLVELIQTLNERRHSVLLECFEAVNTSLQQIFKAVVPQGYADMSIYSRPREDDEVRERTPNVSRGEGTPNRSSPPSVLTAGLPTGSAMQLEGSDEEAVGASLRASFTPASEALPMVSLSGGQKTVVALCLLLAMQRYETAPFYILDEVDAALDERYRSNVAELLKNSGQQYLCTSFRPEFVEIGSKHFKVLNSARVAAVCECSMPDARALVTKEMTTTTTTGT